MRQSEVEETKHIQEDEEKMLEEVGLELAKMQERNTELEERVE